MAVREFNLSGIQYWQSTASKYNARLKEKVHLLLQKLADFGVTDATYYFDKAIYDGRNDVVLNTPEWVNENTMKITATGHAVCFIEFGTGIVYADDHPKMSELGFKRGGYGKGHGKQRTWGYFGEKGSNGREVQTKSGKTLVLTHGNPANRCLYETAKDMRSKILEIAREVFTT